MSMCARQNMSAVFLGSNYGTRSLSAKVPILQIGFFILCLPLTCSPLYVSSDSCTPELKRPPPIPILPIPSAAQLQWQLLEMAIFLHFGPNTFTDSEWGTGRVDPSIFNPVKLDASQWVRVAKDSGFAQVLLTAKHHDGFCLWPSQYTDYSVRSSKWRNGSGDVVGELALAAKEVGISLGLYLSPWDRHESSYGKTFEYNEHYMAQMTELLTWYGEIKQVFLDGAKGKGEKDMVYFFEYWFDLIHQHQPGAVIFSDAGPDIRWVGDEVGVAGSTCWSIFNRSNAEIGGTDERYSKFGDPDGHDWVPAECDVSIRSGWFWHPSQHPKSARTLLDIYYTSVGRNCMLLLNVPPNSSGLISPEDIQVLQEFSKLRKSIFSRNLATNAILRASSTRAGGGIDDRSFSPYNILEEGIYTYWAPDERDSPCALYIDLQVVLSFNVLQLQEPIHMGQRVREFYLESLNRHCGTWEIVASGTTIGYKRLLQFRTVHSQYLRLVIVGARALPLISYLGIHLDTHTIFSDPSMTRSGIHLNVSEVLRTNKSQISAM